MAKKKRGFTTRQIHAEGHGKPMYSHTMPIFQTSTFAFDSPEHGADLFEGKCEGHVYTRLGNPTTQALERTLADLENADESVVFASGLAAIEGCLLPFLQAGDHIISGDTLYGPSLGMFGNTWAKWGIRSTFINTTDLDSLRKAITPDTKFFFFESPANPTNRITDIQAVSDICHEKGVKVVIDNTFATPYNQRPLDLGCDMVMHSMTKYINGHGDGIGGCAIGNKESMDLVREYRTGTGAVMSPFDSYLFLRGLKTLSMRMERHNSNAQAVAEFLESHPDVESVAYPGLPNDPGHEIAKKQMDGFSGMIAFELKGGFDAAKEFLKSTEVFILAVSLGTVDSLIQHPASMTHSKVDKELREQQGLTDGLIRVSVGCEDIGDLLEDIERAIECSKKNISLIIKDLAGAET